MLEAVMADAGKTEPQKQPKKGYNRPQLQVYGDLGTISQTVAAAKGRQDNILPLNNHNLTH
jgi:hypothetical protein